MIAPDETQCPVVCGNAGRPGGKVIAEVKVEEAGKESVAATGICE